jgi:hypothetical protein
METKERRKENIPARANGNKSTKTDIQGGLYKEHRGLSSKVENGKAREDGTFKGSTVVHRTAQLCEEWA